jgi:uncharacterized protein YxeA
MSNSIGWIIGVIVLLLVIACGAYLWSQSDSDNTGASVEMNLPLGGSN